MLNLKSIIKSEEHYNLVLARIYELLQTNILEGSDEDSEIQLLILLTEDFEKRFYSISPPNPIEAIKFRLEQSGISEKELNVILGSRSRKSEILSGKRKLSLNLIRLLHEKLHIPAESLIMAY
ncbi:MAG: helix-turn-helix domain-containing protein [Saprospiraceae bacterium]|jgi:HTH-type transcriptional regulator/antitoxin HigA